MLIRRVRVDPLELLRIVRRAVLRHPELCYEELLIANHVDERITDDDGLDEIRVDFVVVNDGLVTEDDLVVLILFDTPRDLVGRQVEHFRECVRRAQGVFFEEFQ